MRGSLVSIVAGICTLTFVGALASPMLPRRADAQTVLAPDAPALYERLKPSLALVVARDGKDVALGTAFCIGSHDGIAYLLTNKHVIASDPNPRVVLLSDQTTVLYATVDRVSTLDAAVLAVKDTSCAPLTLTKTTPAVGSAVGIVGFPSFQLDLVAKGDRLSASFHAGSVSAIVSGGDLLEYDAQTDHGNSGSPLFDMRTGAVYGLVMGVNTGTTGALQNNLAISVTALASFLDHSRASVAYDGPGSTGQTAAPAAPAPITMAVALDAKCGQGLTGGLIKNLSNANAELNANDYAAATNDSRNVVIAAVTCLNYIPICQTGTPCDDSQRTLVETSQLGGQQLLRIATARTNGDTINALRNEVSTVLALCASPNILNTANPYPIARNQIADSIRVVRTIYRERAYRGVIDADALRSCASKLSLDF